MFGTLTLYPAMPRYMTVKRSGATVNSPSARFSGFMRPPVRRYVAPVSTQFHALQTHRHGLETLSHARSPAPPSVTAEPLALRTRRTPLQPLPFLSAC